MLISYTPTLINFSYNEKTQICDLAFLDFLEDPDVGDIAQDIFIDMNTIPTINMYCRGGHRCCHRGNLNLCGIGDGDCDHDDDCSGPLVCGNNNCLKFRSAGGLWDEEDDCCEQRCTPEHPCNEGEGHCTVDADCKSPGWLKCGGTGSCLNSVYFPRNIFVMNSETFYSSPDSCCYRVCNKRYHL